MKKSLVFFLGEGEQGKSREMSQMSTRKLGIVMNLLTEVWN